MTPHLVYPAEAWADRLAAGNADAAWDEFVTAYRGLLFATIGTLVRDPDERMDAFVVVCDGLRAADMRRLRAWSPEGSARFSTWLVAVCRNLVIDWYRARHGRTRLDPAIRRLEPLQQRVYRLLTTRRLSFVEAYESLRASEDYAGSWRDFLRLVRALHRVVLASAGPLGRELIGVDPTFELAGDLLEPSEPDTGDHARVLESLRRFPPDVQLATLLFIVDDVPADEVARQVGWPNRKAVYNRVYRALEQIREELGGTP